MTHFTLAVATSADGFIARSETEPPQAWASPEEQALFFAEVQAADWAIMGRNTHLAADKPHRRRIIFSSRTKGWQRPEQLWIDPSDLSPVDLADRVSHIHPLENGLILGGTRVHDWFLSHAAIDRITLTIEPITFGAGLPIFSDQCGRDPVETFTSRGFKIDAQQILNDLGTRFLEISREEA